MNLRNTYDAFGLRVIGVFGLAILLTGYVLFN